MGAPTERRCGPPSVCGDGLLSYAIFSLARAHRGYAARLLRDLGLHPGQELLLMRLLDRDAQLQSELLDSVGLDHSTVSKSLRRMQEAGLLTREPAPHDRRALVVSLTDRGRAMRGPLTAMWAELDRAAVAGLDAGAGEAFITTAAAIEAAITERHRRFEDQAAHRSSTAPSQSSPSRSTPTRGDPS